MQPVFTSRTMRRAIALATLLLLVQLGVASPPSGSRIIDRVRDRYESMESLSCTFTHTFVWAMADAEERTSGTMLLLGDDRFRYETDSQIMVSDGETLWRYNLLSKQVIIESLASAAPGSLPKDFLFEFPKDFDVESVEESDDDLYLLHLQPKEENLGLHDVNVWVDSDEWITTRLSFLDDVGNRTEYAIDQVETDVDLDPALFGFDPPDDVTIFDLR